MAQFPQALKARERARSKYLLLVLLRQRTLTLHGQLWLHK